MVAGPAWQNPNHACDVTGDGNITPDDVLALIKDINAKGSRDLTSTSPPTSAPPPFWIRAVMTGLAPLMF